MIANSFKQMTKDGVIKRADASRIRYHDIHVEPGFNLRDTTAPEFQDELESLTRHLERGGKVPALEVRPRDEGGVWLVDGHRRHMAYAKLIERGHPVEWIAVEQFAGNDVERVTRIMTSNEGLKLKPLEIAEGYKRLAAYGLTPDDIARRVCKTRQHVDQLLILANAPHQVQRMVADGDVSASLAVQTVRTHGEKSKHILADAKAKAGAKVTAKAVKPWTPPAKVVAPTLNALESFLESVPLGERVTLESNDTGNAWVQVNAKELRDLFNAFGGIAEAQAAAAEKQRAKAAKAAQADLVEAASDGA